MHAIDSEVTNSQEVWPINGLIAQLYNYLFVKFWRSPTNYGIKLIIVGYNAMCWKGAIIVLFVSESICLSVVYLSSTKL